MANFFDQFDAKPAGNFFDQFDDPKQAIAQPRSAIGEIANQAYAGAVSDLPRMTGQALQYSSDPGRPVYEAGKSLSDWATKQGERPDLQPNEGQHNIVTNALASGARMIPQSIAPAAIVGAGLAASPLALSGAGLLGASAVLGSLPAAMSQGQETLDKGLKAGISPDKAKEAARINALIEGGGETAGTYFGGKLFGLGAKAVGKAVGKGAEGGAGKALGEMTSPGVLKPWLKQIPETAAVEVGTEIGQNAGEAGVEKAYGIDTKSPYEAGKEAIAPTLGMTALLAPFGLAGFAGRAHGARNNAAILSDATSDPKQREIVANDYFSQLKAVDPSAAQEFARNARVAISTNQPLALDNTVFNPAGPMSKSVDAGLQSGVVQQKALEQQLATPAQPSTMPPSTGFDGGVAMPMTGLNQGATNETPQNEQTTVQGSPAGLAGAVGGTGSGEIVSPADAQMGVGRRGDTGGIEARSPADVAPEVQAFRDRRAQAFYEAGYALIIEGRKEEGLRVMADGDAILRGERPQADAQAAGSIPTGVITTDGTQTKETKSAAPGQSVTATEPGAVDSEVSAITKRHGKKAFVSTSAFSVSTEDNGDFEVVVNRASNGDVLIRHPDGLIEHKAAFAKGKSDAELLAYDFEPVGFKSATKQAEARQPAQPGTTADAAGVDTNKVQIRATLDTDKVQLGEESQEPLNVNKADEYKETPAATPKPTLAEGKAAALERGKAKETPEQKADRLTAEYDKIEPFSGQDTGEARDAAASAIADHVSTEIAAGNMPAYQVSDEGAFITISPSARQQGAIQVTRYIKSGIVGDSQYNSVAEAVSGEGLYNNRRMTRSETDAALSDAVRAESEYQSRRESAEKAGEARTVAAGAPKVAALADRLKAAAAKAVGSRKAALEARLAKLEMAKPDAQKSAKGFEAVAQRQVNAENRFVDSVVEQFGLSRDDATSAWNYYLKNKLVKVDSVGGQYNLTDGRLWDAGALKQAAAELGSRQSPAQTKGSSVIAQKTSPIMRRDDIVGEIMRITGGDGISPTMARDITGDSANRASKLRGLFTNRGQEDLDDIATNLQLAGYDVRDGNHLSELLREASFGNFAVSMERQERDKDAEKERQHRDRIRAMARKYKINAVAVKFSDLESRVLSIERLRNDKAVSALSARDKKRFDSAVSQSENLLSDDEIRAILNDIDGRGISGREKWQEALVLMRQLAEDARHKSLQGDIENATATTEEPDWFKDIDEGSDSRTGNEESTSTGGEFGLEGQSAEEIRRQEAERVAAEKAARESAEKAEQEEKAKANKAEKDRRAAEVLKEREAAKKAEVDKAADTFELGQDAPAPVVKKVTTKDAIGQKDVFDDAPAPQSATDDQNTIKKADAKEPWEMTRDEFAEDALNKNEYAAAYRKDEKLKKEFLYDQRGAWIKALVNRAEHGRIPDNVLDDFVEKYGLDSMVREFRGVHEKGVEGYFTPDIRNAPRRPDPVRTTWDKEKYERTWAEERSIVKTLDSLPKTPAYWREAKDAHRKAISKASYEGRTIPDKVKSDYPDLFPAKKADAESAVDRSKAAPVQDQNFYYTNGDMGMKSDGSFTAEKRHWMTFSLIDALRLDANNTKPYGATRKGVFTGTVSGESVKQPQKPTDETGLLKIKEPESNTGEGANDDASIATLASHDALIERARAGEATAKELQDAFASVRKNEDAIKAELSALTKDALLKRMGSFAAARWKSDKKAAVVNAAWSDLVSDFALARPVSYSLMGKDSHANAIAKMVEDTTDEDIADFAKRVKTSRQEYIDRFQQYKKQITEPESLEDFLVFIRVKGESELTPEQRAKYDDLRSDDTREKAQKDNAKIGPSYVKVGSKIVETKHTRDGYDLFVVQIETRVERDEYIRLNAAARKLGGGYSRFSKGFQFKDRTSAEAFQKLAEGDNKAAQEVVSERVEARQEGSKSAAAERLNAMADRMEKAGQLSLNADRMTNTAKRARQASSAEAQASSMVAMAKTMRNLASALQSGEAKHLEGIRNRAQIEMLDSMAKRAQQDGLNKQYPSYADQQKYKGKPLSVEDAQYAEWPTATADRGDLLSVIRYLEESGKPAVKALSVKIQRLADGANTNRAPVPFEIIEQVLEKLEGTKQFSSVPYYWDTVRERTKRLASMGISNLPMLRSAIREYVQFKESGPKANRAKELERALIGNKGIGIDFFPTPKAVAQDMVRKADIQPGMKVLEPSAGNGNIAEAIEAAGVAPDVVEMSASLREILDAKGFNLVGQDFMQTDGQYDRIVMNPPFSNRLDAEHVQHAYTLLNPGGKIVAIMGEGVFFGTDAKAKQFREWLDSVGGTSEKLPEGTFTDKTLMATTGVNSRMVEIEKPGDTRFNQVSQATITPLDSAIYDMAAEGKSAQEILDFIGATSRRPFNRYLAKALRGMGVFPSVTTERPVIYRADGSHVLGRDSTLPQEQSPSNNVSAALDSNVLELHSLLRHINNLLKIPRNMSVLADSANSVDGNSSPEERSLNGMRFDAKTLRDIVQQQSFIEQGFSGINVESQRTVRAAVLRSIKNDKVVDSVIKLVPVDVMDMLRAEKITPDMLRHNPSVLQRAITGNLIKDVAASAKVSRALLNSVALSTAIEVSTSSNVSRPSEYGGPAIRAINSNHATDYTRQRNDNGRIKYSAAYNPRTDTVILFSNKKAESDVLHEFVHAATLKAIAKGGRAALEMKRLFEHLKAEGSINGMYGMANIEEFVAEAFSNPKFQQALKAIAAPKGSRLQSAWDWFVGMVSRIMGFKSPAQVTALDKAMVLGAELMRENAALNSNVNSSANRYAIAHHGTPHVFAPEPGFPHGRFRLDKMGTGEGAQAYGWGVYLAQAQDVAKSYSGKLSSELFYAGKPMNRDSSRSSMDSAAWALYLANGDKTAAKSSGLAKQELIDALDPAKLSPGGNLYRLDIPDDVMPKLMDWDKPLSEQSAAVRKALRSMVTDVAGSPNASRANRDIARAFNPYGRDDLLEEISKRYGWAIKGDTLVKKDGSVVPESAISDQLKMRQRGKIYDTAGDLYRDLAQVQGSDADVSSVLAANGIPGLRYLDGQSRTDGAGSHNYVIWDQKTLDRIALLERNGEALDDLRFNQADDGNVSGNVSGNISGVLFHDDNENAIVWDGGDYRISVNRPGRSTSSVLWHKESVKGKDYWAKRGQLSTFESEKFGKKWLRVQEVAIEGDHRGNGLGLKLYQSLLDQSGSDVAGVLSHSASITNKKQIPAIHRMLGAKLSENGDFYVIAKPESKDTIIIGGVERPRMKKPWQMTRAEYDTAAPTKTKKVFYEKVGSIPVEIVRNPTSNDIAAMKSESRREFPNATAGDAMLRRTEDSDGNSYYWKAHLAVHQQIEPLISARDGVAVNQNAAQRLSHRGVVRKALYDGENVPVEILDEYPNLLSEVQSIHGNKIEANAYKDKSATGNEEFSPDNPDIRYNVESDEDANKGASYKSGSVSTYSLPESLAKSLHAASPNASAFVAKSGEAILLSELVIPKEERGAGSGSAFMAELARYADENGMDIVLTADGDYGGSKVGQQRFYRRHGFVLNAGRNKDFRYRENMIRRPADAIRYNVAADFIRTSPQVQQIVANAFASDSSTSWITPFNTQFHKAQKWAAEGKPWFKKVFDLGQQFLSDVSRFAVMAQSQAPNLFHEIKGARGVVDAIKGIRSIDDITGKTRIMDAEAIASPLYEGTLHGGGSPMKGRVFSDAELRAKYKLSDKQIRLYREALAAVNVSLDEMAKSIIAKHAKNEGLGFDNALSVNTMADEIIKSLEQKKSDIGQQALEQTQELLKKMDESGSQQKMQAIVDAAEKASERIASTIKDVRGIVATNSSLQKHGYFPLMRFGKNTVTATDEDGKVQFFGMYEGVPLVPKSGQYQANRIAAEIRAENPTWTVETGIHDTERYKLYQGLNLEAVQLFAAHMDQESKEPFQEFLRVSTNDRSVQNRLIHRKGTPGFDRDVRRTLAQFITSNARHTSSNYHLFDMGKAASEVPQKYGDISGEAVRLHKYISEPMEEAQKLRGFMFFNYLGGSIASAAVNMTQIPAMTFPFLSKYESVGALGRRLALAAKLSMSDPKDVTGKVGEALRRAEMDGVTAPQEIHQLMATASNNIFAGSQGVNLFMRGWGKMFAMAETFNRRTTFIAAYQIAERMTPKQLAETGSKDAFQFAENAVKETQGIYNKGNRPNVGRGAVGATLMTFKQYSIMYLELLKRLPPKQRMIMMGVLMLSAGAGGLPFEEDIEDIIDTFGQWLGFATNTNRTIRKAATSVLGERGADIALNGLLSQLGIDVHSRLGMQNLLPGTGILKQSSVNKGRDIKEFFGPAGSLIASVGNSLENLATGQPGKAALDIAPVAVQNAFKGAKMAATGYAEDAKGRRTVPVDVEEAIAKGVGFNPKSVAEFGQLKRGISQDARLLQVKRESFSSALVDAILSGDAEARQEVMAEIRKWNENNPSMRVVINPGAIANRVRSAKMEGVDRFLKTTPRTMRGEAATEFR